MKQYLLLVLAIVSGASTHGQTYWQQHVDTKIEVTLDDRANMLHGYEELTYTNYSPDTLKFIYIHLWPNAYKNDHTPFARQMEITGKKDFYYSTKEQRGYIDSLQFRVGDLSTDINTTTNAPDIARVNLPYPLVPGEKVTLTTPFRVKLPEVFSRSGHTGQAYYVSQWFPKPAVYDSKGWHPLSYVDQGEFYSEFGSYDVTVTLPQNYVILATGNCVTTSENEWLDEVSKRQLPPDTLGKDQYPPSATSFKSVRFTEDNVHDFAWFADKRFIVRKDTVLSPGTSKVITTWTAFLPGFHDSWKNANDYLKEAVKSYGERVGPYPYNTIKAVLGDMRSGGGMEYPTVTLIDTKSSSSLRTVIIHEAGHNWFYGMLGSNERANAWMDEGLNTFYEQKTTASNGKMSLAKKTGLDESLFYYHLAASGNDQPINTHAENFRNMNYGIDVYYKTSLMLQWLEQYMTEDSFAVGMKDYFDKWHFKHPYPADFRAIMQSHTDKSLDWFFDTILNTDKRIDFKITKTRTNDGVTVATLKNNTGVVAPLHVGVYKDDSLLTSVWTEPFADKTTITFAQPGWNKLRVEDEIPDAKTANNAYRKRALFHHFGIALKPFLGTNRIEKDKLFMGLSTGSNKYDGIMLGLVLHNLTIPENRFSFAIAPLFSFNTETINGAGSIGYTWFPNSTFHDIMLNVDAKSFHNNVTDYNLTKPLYTRYIKVAPSLIFTFKERNPLSTVTRTLVLKEYNINEEEINFGSDSLAKPSLTNSNNIYFGLRYQHKNERTYNPFSYELDAHGNGDFAKLNLQGNIKIDYNTRRKALYVRGYFGKFFAFNNDPAATSRYWLNATYGGMNDYLYDGTYRGRNVNDGFSGQQISSVQEGGFKIPVYNGAYRSDNWMAAVNLKTDLPKIGLPIRLFLDAGLVPNPNPGFNNVKSTLSLFDAGIEVYLSNDIVSFYFPLLMSNDFHDYLSSTFGNSKLFARSISFTIHLQNIIWLRTPSRLLTSMLKNN